MKHEKVKTTLKNLKNVVDPRRSAHINTYWRTNQNILQINNTVACRELQLFICTYLHSRTCSPWTLHACAVICCTSPWGQSVAVVHMRTSLGGAIFFFFVGSREFTNGSVERGKSVKNSKKFCIFKNIRFVGLIKKNFERMYHSDDN